MVIATILIILLLPKTSEGAVLTDAQVQVKNKIELAAALHNVDIDKAVKIAWCESRLGKDLKNPNSSASGVYQFLRGSFRWYGQKFWWSFEDRDVFNEDDSIDLAMKVMSSNRGFKDWEASKNCWSNQSLLFTKLT